MSSSPTSRQRAGNRAGDFCDTPKSAQRWRTGGAIFFQRSARRSIRLHEFSRRQTSLRASVAMSWLVDEEPDLFGAAVPFFLFPRHRSAPGAGDTDCWFKWELEQGYMRWRNQFHWEFAELDLDHAAGWLWIAARHQRERDETRGAGLFDAPLFGRDSTECTSDTKTASRERSFAQPPRQNIILSALDVRSSPLRGGPRRGASHVSCRQPRHERKY